MRLDFPNIEGNIDIYMKVMRAICGETQGKSMVDLCCAFAPNTPKLGFELRIYVDFYCRLMDHPGEQVNFIQDDVKNFLYRQLQIPRKFDVTICSDGIEHLLQQDGIILLDLMEKTSDKQIIFTPLGEIFKLAEQDNHDPEAHRSLWTPEMFLERGYAVIVYPHYHRVWNGGGIFAWRSENIQQDFERVKSLL